MPLENSVAGVTQRSFIAANGTGAGPSSQKMTTIRAQGMIPCTRRYELPCSRITTCRKTHGPGSVPQNMIQRAPRTKRSAHHRISMMARDRHPDVKSLYLRKSDDLRDSTHHNKQAHIGNNLVRSMRSMHRPPPPWCCEDVRKR